MYELLLLLGGLTVLTFVALPAARTWGRAHPRRALAAVLGFGLLFRLLLLPAGLAPGAGLAADLAGGGPSYERFLLYDNDVWRYLWEGRVTTRGGNPYARTPADLEYAADQGDPWAESLFEHDGWWEVYENVSYRRQPTVYPPAAQLLFALSAWLAPASAGFWKLLVLLAEGVTCLAVVGLLRAAGRPRVESLLYAWNPMAIKELAGSGHVDAFAIALTAVSAWLLVSGRARGAWAFLAAASLVKVAPLFLVPLWLRRAGWRAAWAFPVVALALCLPFAAHLDRLVAGVAAFGSTWEFNPGPWALLEATAEPVAGAMAGSLASLVGLLVVVTLALLTARANPAAGGHPAAGVFLVLGTLAWIGPTVMPWYLLWALPFAVAVGARSWVVLSAACSLSYLFYVHREEQLWWLVVGHGAGALALALEIGFDPALKSRILRALGITSETAAMGGVPGEESRERIE